MLRLEEEIRQTAPDIVLLQAHNDYVMAEKKREEWELKNHREGEILEMVEIFEVCGGQFGKIVEANAPHDRTGCIKSPSIRGSPRRWRCRQSLNILLCLGQERGMSRQDAEDVIEKMAKYDDFFVNLMMNEELGLQVCSDRGRHHRLAP